MALLLGLVGLAALPAAIEASRRSKEIDLLDAAWAIPVTLVLCLVAFVMARRARESLRWIRLRGGGTAVASTAVIIGALGVCLAVMAALSVGFYELVVLYQESR